MLWKVQGTCEIRVIRLPISHYRSAGFTRRRPRFVDTMRYGHMRLCGHMSGWEHDAAVRGVVHLRMWKPNWQVITRRRRRRGCRDSQGRSVRYQRRRAMRRRVAAAIATGAESCISKRLIKTCGSSLCRGARAVCSVSESLLGKIARLCLLMWNRNTWPGSGYTWG